MNLTIAVLMAVFTGPAPAALGELCPTGVRSRGMSIAANGAVVIFVGFAPFLSTWLIARIGSPLAPKVYMTAAALAVTAHARMR